MWELFTLMAIVYVLWAAIMLGLDMWEEAREDRSQQENSEETEKSGAGCDRS